MRLRILAFLLAAVSNHFAQVGGDVGHQAVSELRAGDYAAARQILETALKQSPKDARLWTLHGLAVVRLGDQSLALSSFKRALQIAPTYYPALEGAAQVESQAGSPDAITTLQRMLAIRPDDDTALRELAFCLVKQKRPAEALPIFQRLAKAQPTDQKVLLDLAAVQFLTAHYRDVIATLTPIASKESADVDVLDLLAEAYGLNGDTEKALTVLQAAIAASPGTAQPYLDFANICLTRGLFQSGIDTVSAGILRMSDSAPLYIARGVLYSELADYDKGEADFKRAEQLDPNVEGGSVAKGLAELQHNDLNQAEATVRERLRAKPHDAFLQYLLAEILTRKGAAPGTAEFREALNAARESTDSKPDFALGRDLLGRLYLEQGNIEEAIEQSRLALRLSPTDQKALYHLIVALRKGNRTEELPALLKQLILLREQTGEQETTQHNYALVEQSNAKNASASQP